MNRHFIWIITLILALWPTWLWYGARMTDGSDEPYGIIALIAAGILLWRDRKEMNPTRAGIIAALALLLLVSLTHHLLPNLVTGVLSMSLLILASGVTLRNPGIWGLLLLSLPLIANLQFYLGYPLRWIAAVSAQGLLNLFAQDIQRNGTLLTWQGSQVGVDPPCSGIAMLWLGLFLAALLCAIRRYRLPRFTLVMMIAAAGIVAANCLRVTLLFLKESGRVSLPEWTHDGIGIAVFTFLVWLLDRYFDKPSGNDSTHSNSLAHLSRRPAAALISMTLLMSVLPFFAQASRNAATEPDTFPGWPTTWDGKYLEPLPLTESEEVFASNFPGKIAVFTTGPDKVIMRWVTRPTRKLHSSADCLRAAGYHIETERAGRFIASDSHGHYLVDEVIFNDDDTWNEVSPWFWAASFKQTEGPWWAVTTLSSPQG